MGESDQKYFDEMQSRLTDVERRRAALEREERALRKIVEGLVELNPALAGKETVAPFVMRKGPAEGTVGHTLDLLFDKCPGQFFTVKQLVETMPDEIASGLKDPEAAVRAALNNLGRLEKKRADGRSFAYGRFPNQRDLEAAG
jgi:transposase